MVVSVKICSSILMSPGFLGSNIVRKICSPSVLLCRYYSLTPPSSNDNNAISTDIAEKQSATKSDCSGIPGPVDVYFEMSQSFRRSDTWASQLIASMLVYPNFITPEEEAEILREIEPYLKRLHYESSHWDDAIHNYRETERAKWNKKNSLVINRIRGLCFPQGVPQLRFVHILDLEKTGVIKPHIDSVRFCGNTIAGLSLLSDSIMRLRHDVQKDFYCDVWLPRFSLYLMRDFARYEFTHEILGESDSKFKNKTIPRDRRISIICRNEPDSSTKGPVFTPLES